MSDLFSTDPYPGVEDVDGPTAAALLGDGAAVRDVYAEDAGLLADAGVPVRERCPSCGVELPDEAHLVDAAMRQKDTPGP